MSATPFAARGVHFEDISIASFGTPISVAAPTSVDYLNAQLVAHGFTHGAGLNLAELRGRDQQDVLKCLTNMLGQRLDDMTRAEQLSAKYKTLSYDHERLLEQHRLAKEAAAHAEREMETGKAKAETAQKNLAAEEEAHRKAKEERHKLRLAMAYLRTTTTAEVKRKQGEMEKISERMSKIANDQAKLGAIGSGLACANLLPEKQSKEESNTIWESALADSEAARLRLLKENDALRDVILACANALQTLHYTTISSSDRASMDDPELILSDVLFASTSKSTRAETAQERLRELFASLREAISKSSMKGRGRRQSMQQTQEYAAQIKVLQEENAELQVQLNEAQEAARAQGQQLLEQFVTDARFMAGQRNIADMSMDLMGTPDKGPIAERIKEQQKHLESERDKLTEAAVKLGREKAALEAERLQFLEGKRGILLQEILDDLPPTPEAAERSQPTQAPVDVKPLADLAVAGVKKDAKPAAATQEPARKTHPTVTFTLPSSSASSKPAQVPSNPLPLVLEQAELGASTTPPFSEDELSPTSPTEQLSRSLHSAQPSKPTYQAPPALPPSFRTQTTPVRPSYQQARIQHKYSPAVPSPLSRVIRVESPPSSPESKAQREALRPAVIAEEDEEEEEEPVINDPQVVVTDEVAEEEDDDHEEPPLHIGGRPGSLSPLSRIMNMGLSPAIAPTLAIPSFPGLLGTGPLGQDLLAKPKQTTIGFGKMPGGFQLGTAIQAQSLLGSSNTATGTARMTAKTIKTTAVAKQKPKQEQKTKPTKVVLGENRPRSSKESTSSSGSGSEGRTSRASSKTSASGSATTAVKAKTTAVKGKENEVKRKPVVSSSKPVPVKRPVPTVTKPVSRPPVATTIKKTAGTTSTIKPIASRAPKG